MADGCPGIRDWAEDIGDTRVTKPARQREVKEVSPKSVKNDKQRTREFVPFTYTVPAVMMPVWVDGTGTTVILCEEWDGCVCSCFSVLTPPATAVAGSWAGHCE